jgi:hypothetical protein
VSDPAAVQLGCSSPGAAGRGRPAPGAEFDGCDGGLAAPTARERLLLERAAAEALRADTIPMPTCSRSTTPPVGAAQGVGGSAAALAHLREAAAAMRSDTASRSSATRPGARLDPERCYHYRSSQGAVRVERSRRRGAASYAGASLLAVAREDLIDAQSVCAMRARLLRAALDRCLEGQRAQDSPGECSPCRRGSARRPHKDRSNRVFLGSRPGCLRSRFDSVSVDRLP